MSDVAFLESSPRGRPIAFAETSPRGQAIDAATLRLLGGVSKGYSSDEDDRFVWEPGDLQPDDKPAKAYDPEQPRDWHGRWGSATGLDAETPEDKLPQPATARGALMDYVSGGHRFINGLLRASIQGAGAVIAEASRGILAEQIESLDKMFESAPPLEHDITVFRGTRGFDVKPGTMRDDGFASTTTSYAIAAAWGGDVMQIHVPAGTRVLAVKGREREVLLPRGGRFEVARPAPGSGRLRVATYKGSRPGKIGKGYVEEQHPRDKGGRWTDGEQGERPRWRRPTLWGAWGGSHTGSRDITARAASTMGIPGYELQYEGRQQGMDAVASQMLTRIAESPGADEPLWHAFENVEHVEWKVGDTLRLPPMAANGGGASNTEGYGIRSFREDQRGEPTVFEFPKGTPFCPYHEWSANDQRDLGYRWSEAIVAGGFKVVGVSSYKSSGYQHWGPGGTGGAEHLTVTVVKLEPTETFDPATGKWRKL